jgi:hypothetical protein
MSITLYALGVLIEGYLHMMERVNTDPIAYVG